MKTTIAMWAAFFVIMFFVTLGIFTTDFQIDLFQPDHSLSVYWRVHFGPQPYIPYEVTQ